MIIDGMDELILVEVGPGGWKGGQSSTCRKKTLEKGSFWNKHNMQNIVLILLSVKMTISKKIEYFFQTECILDGVLFIKFVSQGHVICN